MNENEQLAAQPASTPEKPIAQPASDTVINESKDTTGIADGETTTLEQPVNTETPVKEADNATDEVAQTEQDSASADAEESGRIHSLTKEELLEAMRVIVAEKQVQAHKKVTAIKQAYYVIHNREVETQLEEYVQANGSPEGFVSESDAVEGELKDLFTAFREMRTEFQNQEEMRRKENLDLKLRIIDQLRAIAEDIDNINRHYSRFQELQSQFKEINDIPDGEVANVWKTYQLVVESFYDHLKMNKDLRDMDFKKNLEVKRGLIEEARALETMPDPVDAFRRLQTLHDKWRETGPIAKEIRENIWEEFKGISTVINRRHQEYFEARKASEQANEAAKSELCEKIEAIDIDAIKSFSEWDKFTAEILDLQAKWKKIGFASRKTNNALFTRFRAACDKFFQTKAEYYRATKENYAKNLALKTALCEKAEALADMEDERKAMEEVNKLQTEWRTVGTVARKHSDAIWERFTKACNVLYARRKARNTAQRQEENANLAAKRAIVEALRAIDLDAEEREEAIRKVKELQSQWNSIGHVPFGRKDALIAEYRAEADRLYDGLNMRRRRADMNRYTQSLSQMSNDESKLNSERQRLQRALDNKRAELQTAENNMGFFAVKSSQGSSMIREMEKRIDRLHSDIEEISAKIAAVDSL